MYYPAALIEELKNKKITRGEFCRRFAATQGFNGDTKSISTKDGFFIFYRGRVGNYENNQITWLEHDGEYCAPTIKQMKIIIDIKELRATTWTNY